MNKKIFVLALVFISSLLSVSALEYLPAQDFIVKPATQGNEYYLYLETTAGITIPFILMVPGPQSAPTGAVIFLPQYQGTASMWKTQALKATAGGVFSISLQVETSIPGKTTIDWSQADAAVGQIIAWLRTMASIKADRIGLVGASLGGRHVLTLFAADPTIYGVFSLSPGLNYDGYRPVKARSATAGRIAIVAAAMDDSQSLIALETNRTKYPGAEYLWFPNGGHGYQLVQTQPEVAKRLQDFLLGLR